MENDLFLVYVNPVGKISEDFYMYDFYFSKNPDIVWGPDWDKEFPNTLNDTLPEKTTYDEVKRIVCNIPFKCAQQNMQIGLYGMVDGIIACAWEDISSYEEYPTPFRIVFKWAETLKSVEEKLATRHQFFEE